MMCGTVNADCAIVQGLLKQKTTHGKEYITAVSRTHELYQGAQKDLKANPQPESLPVAQESSKTDDSKIVTTAYYRYDSISGSLVPLCMPLPAGKAWRTAGLHSF